MNHTESLNTEEAWPPSVALGELLLEAPVEEPHWHEFNPWGEFCVYVTVEELAACHKMLGRLYEIDGMSQPLTVELIIEIWQREGDGLDAYIIPDALVTPGLPSAGVRFGTEGHEYLTPHCDSAKMLELLARYGRKQR